MNQQIESRELHRGWKATRYDWTIGLKSFAYGATEAEAIRNLGPLQAPAVKSHAAHSSTYCTAPDREQKQRDHP